GPGAGPRLLYATVTFFIGTPRADPLRCQRAPHRLARGRMTFGQMIRHTRSSARLAQNALAARIRKPDGQPISPTYLHDLEQDRRHPPRDAIIEQLAVALAIPREVL